MVGMGRGLNGWDGLTWVGLDVIDWVVMYLFGAGEERG